MTERYIPVEVERAALLRVLNDASDTRLASTPDVMWGASRVLLAVRELMEESQPRPATIDDLLSEPVQRDLRDMGAVLDEAHLDDPLTGKVSFIFIEKWGEKEATDHLMQMHGKQLDDDDLPLPNLDALYALHTRLHPTEGHCHAKGGHRTVQVFPMLNRMDNPGEHLATQHCLVPPYPDNSPDEAHRLAHAHGCSHEHRRA